jgi:translation initiation factor IF-2
MAALSDHIRRDADAAALAEITLYLGQFKRRAHEAAKTANKQTVESAGDSTVPFDYGIKAGRLNALQALREFLPELDKDIQQAEAAAALERGSS